MLHIQLLYNCNIELDILSYQVILYKSIPTKAKCQIQVIQIGMCRINLPVTEQLLLVENVLAFTSSSFESGVRAVNHKRHRRHCQAGPSQLEPLTDREKTWYFDICRGKDTTPEIRVIGSNECECEGVKYRRRSKERNGGGKRRDVDIRKCYKRFA
ncbi:hypothetical protein ABVT39_023608 [Epinephelus coioides]